MKMCTWCDDPIPPGTERFDEQNRVFCSGQCIEDDRDLMNNRIEQGDMTTEDTALTVGVDTDELVDRLEKAVEVYVELTDKLHHSHLTDPEVEQQSQAIRDIVDHWSYLRHVLAEGLGPLPAAWAQAAGLGSGLGDLCEEAWTVIANAGEGDWSQETARWRDAADRWRDRWFEVLAAADPAPAGPGVPSAMDTQLDQLSTAIGAMQDALDDDGISPAEFVAKAEQLLTCVSAVDHAARLGELPAAWADPFWRRRVVTAAVANTPGTEVADPRVTANGAAAAKAGWDLAAGSNGTALGWARVELMGRRVRVGVVSEVTLLGETMMRIDYPDSRQRKAAAPEFYKPSALYGITPLPADPFDTDDSPDADPYGEGFDPYREDPF